MDYTTALDLTKQRIGFTSSIRDVLVLKIVEGVAEDLEQVHGINLDLEKSRHLMFVVDMAVYRYQSKDDSGALPRNLQYRLHNLILKDGGAT